MAPLAASVIAEAEARLALPTPTERRAQRRAAGLSLRKIGRHLGVSAQCVAFWELGAGNGGREPSGQHLVDYVELLTELARIKREAAG